MCRYNLSSLINEVFTVTNANGVQYKFSVCGNLPDDVCGIRTGTVLYLNTNNKTCMRPTLAKRRI